MAVGTKDLLNLSVLQRKEMSGSLQLLLCSARMLWCCGEGGWHVRDNAWQGVHYQEWMDDVNQRVAVDVASVKFIHSWLWTPRRVLFHLYHCHSQKNNNDTINLYYCAFCSQYIKFLTSNNSISPATSESLTNTWNKHYKPIRSLCNENLAKYCSK